MKNSFKLTALYAVLAMLSAGCAMNVHTQVDREVDFTQYKTFCWMQGCEFKISGPAHLVNDTLLRKNVKNAIVRELKTKGITQDDSSPDLLVAFTITVKDEQSIVYQHTDDSPFYEKMEAEPRVYNYLKGSIVIAMADRKSSKIVWESLAERYLELNPDLSEENISKGIHLVLKNFPPHK